MKTTSKKFVSLLLTLVMALSLAIPAFAADTLEAGEMTMTSGGVTFTNETYVESGSGVAAYVTSAVLPNVNLRSVPVTIRYNGTALKINGTQVSTGGSYTGTVDIAGQVTTIEVVSGEKSRVYYTAAYNSKADFQVEVKIDYSTLEAFSRLTPNSAYTGPSGRHCPYLDTVTADQIQNARDALDMLAMIEPAVYDGTASVNSTAMAALAAYAANSDGTLMVTNEDGREISEGIEYVYDINFVNPDSSATYTYGTATPQPAGGWMFSVIRGGSEAYYPMISAAYFQVMPGDVITWSYTCDLGYDLGKPMM